MEAEAQDNNNLIEILKNVVVLTRLFSAKDAEYMINYVVTVTSNDKFDTKAQINYNYVTIKRPTESAILDSIKQLSACSRLDVGEIHDMCRILSTENTPVSERSYFLDKEENRLVSRASHEEPRRFPCVYIDPCPFSKKARFSFSVAFLKKMLPNFLENVERLEDEVIESPNHKTNPSCIICLDRERDVIIMPCHHVVMCLLCTGSLKDYKCPTCKGNISSIERVYM